MDKEYFDKVLQTFSELNTTIQDAGGCAMTWKQLKETPLIELLYILGTNHITFKWEGPSKSYAPLKEEDK